MTRRSYLLTAVVWALLVASIAFLARPLAEVYLRPVAAAGEVLARLAAPQDVVLEVGLEPGKMRFSASRAGKGLVTALDTDLLNAAASLLLATAILTPLGSPARRVLGTAIALLAFILVMGLVAAGLALVPLVQGGFVASRVVWRAAAMAHNVSTSGLVISFPAAIWFLATLRWWRAHFSTRP